MEPRIQSDSSPRVSTLVSEIVTDVQTLVRKELQLAKTELTQDWVRAKNAAALFAGAYFLFALGSAFAFLALAQGLIAMGFPTGGAYSLIAILLGGIGLCSYLLAKRWIRALSLVPEVKEQISEMRERLQLRPAEQRH